MNNDFQEQYAIAYFLGELSEAEQSAVEERFFTDAEFSDRLDEVEIDLIDSYVRGELEAGQSGKFEEHFLISEHRRNRVRAAAALWESERSAVSVPVAPLPKVSFWKSLTGFFSFPQLAYGSLAVLLLALIGGLVLFWPRSSEIVKIVNENLQTEPQKTPLPAITPPLSDIPQNDNPQSPEPQKTPVPNQPKETPKTELPLPKPREVAPVMARVDLFSVSSRSGNGSESNKVSLKADTMSVYLRLRFKTEEEFIKYRVELRDAADTAILTKNTQNKKDLGITVGAKKLRKGIYKITLQGAKADGEFELLDVYNFVVEKK